MAPTPTPTPASEVQTLLRRREVLRLAAAGTLCLGWGVWNRGFAGEPGADGLGFPIPADKHLDPAWVRSLTARGEATTYQTAEELAHIGMPIGGIGAGQLYLGGDGRLWLWDIFNQHRHTGFDGPAYARPPKPASPLAQGFAIAVGSGATRQVRILDRRGFSDLTFSGHYPLGRVSYRDPALPLSISLEAFSPHIPLSAEDSSLPATIMEFSVANRGPDPVEVELFGWLQNAVYSAASALCDMRRTNQVLRSPRALAVIASGAPAPMGPERPAVVFADFEGDAWPEGWTTEGEAFGSGPRHMPIGPVDLKGQHGASAAVSFDPSRGDGPQGCLLSPVFTIERHFIIFLIGGGHHAKDTHVDLVVDGKPVRTATGADSDHLHEAMWDVRELAGQRARIVAVDHHSGGWGHIDLDYIRFVDRLPPPPDDAGDAGTMGLALVGSEAGDWAVAGTTGSPEDILAAAGKPAAEREAPVSDHAPCAAVGRRLTIAPGATATAAFIVAWHFPHLRILAKDAERPPDGRRYATRFADAAGVIGHIAGDFPRLAGATRLWHRTWYEDATLPWWFLERTLINAAIAATNTCMWFANGRFWGWEGVGCCEGTCTHVWQYAHSLARLFPALERSAREMQDFGTGFDTATGLVRFRGETDHYAADGQAGVILRAYREHQMSADDAFLRRNWERIRRALEYLIAQDRDQDGILKGAQHNTQDEGWFGPVAWLSSLYIAALRAGEAMAIEVGDDAFAGRARALAASGSRLLASELFNGDYFINKPDPAHPQAPNSANGCAIDQVFGQSWAWQVGLPRILPEAPTRSALQALWRYNFAPDIAPFRARFAQARVYILPGEAGLVMCTWPKGGREQVNWKNWATKYFNECWTGCEYQVAGHMLWEGMVTEGLAVTRAIHDRYHAAKRNPWNEVECGDHYARAMASHGVYLAACGYEHHGPKGHLGFAPRLGAADFRAAFTAAEGWGLYAQRYADGGLSARVEVRHGRLGLRTLALTMPEGRTATAVVATVAGAAVAATVSAGGKGRALIAFAPELDVAAGQQLVVVVTSSPA